MPYVIRPKRGLARLLPVSALALAASVAVAAPAAAKGPGPALTVPGMPALSTTTSVPDACVPPSFSQIFLRWRDTGLYTLSPGGSMETGLPGWTLGGGAEPVAGNEPFYVGGSTHDTSLSIPSGGTVTSSRMCIDRTYPSFRFFARNSGSAKSDLVVDVVWHESGAVHSARAELDRKAGSTWGPVRSLRLPSGALSTGTLEPVSFRFKVVGSGGAWQVDDLYVDPWARR